MFELENEEGGLWVFIASIAMANLWLGALLYYVFANA